MTGAVRVALGPNQIKTLAFMANPTLVMLVADARALRLAERGMLRCVDGSCCITPAGMRAVADALEAGRIDDGLTIFARDKAAAAKEAGR